MSISFLGAFLNCGPKVDHALLPPRPLARPLVVRGRATSEPADERRAAGVRGGAGRTCGGRAGSGVSERN